jgi:hypothetical protein
MSIIEAIASGKPFKRPHYANYLSAEGGAIRSGGAAYALPVKDIVAIDWEVQEPKVTITRTQFFSKAAEAATFLRCGKKKKFTEKDIIDMLAHVLGF